ncbi:MAG: MaoC family dehydratase [Myxococcota bacterium]
MSNPTRLASLADLAAIDGKPLGASSWQTLTFEDIVRFADATGDHQWIHVDRERALRESPFKAPIAHGYYAIARIAGLFSEVVTSDPTTFIVNYGINRARFPAALVEGCRYRLQLTHGSTKPRDDGADVVFQATMEIEDSERPACVAEVLFRFRFA